MRISDWSSDVCSSDLADRADDADGTLKFVETLFGRSCTRPQCARPETGEKRHGDLAKIGGGIDIAVPTDRRIREAGDIGAAPGDLFVEIAHETIEALAHGVRTGGILHHRGEVCAGGVVRSAEHPSELQPLIRTA